MMDDFETVSELVRSAAAARFRICRVEGEEHPDRSWHQVTCHLHRQDVSWGAIPLIYVIGAFSFADARPRGHSDMDYFEEDQWLFGDLLLRLRFGPTDLAFDADYVRGRMMKTTVRVGQTGEFVVATRNRHEMALRWLRAIKGKKHLELIL